MLSGIRGVSGLIAIAFVRGRPTIATSRTVRPITLVPELQEVTNGLRASPVVANRVDTKGTVPSFRKLEPCLAIDDRLFAAFRATWPH